MRRIYILVAVASMVVLMMAWSSAVVAQPQGSGGHFEATLDGITLSGGQGGSNCSDIFNCTGGGVGGHLSGVTSSGEEFNGGQAFTGSTVSGVDAGGAGGCITNTTTGERQCEGRGGLGFH
jgi:opacity protein-like surface antigen